MKYELDFQVIQMLPDSLLILNKPFIQILKKDHGLALIKHIKSQFVQSIIEICAFANATNKDEILLFLSKIR